MSYSAKGGFCVDHILKKIVEIDSKAYNLKEKKEQLKIDKQKELAQKKEELRKEIISKAKKEGSQIAENYKSEGLNEVEKIQKDTEASCKLLEEQYERIKDSFCEDMFKKVFQLDLSGK